VDVERMAWCDIFFVSAVYLSAVKCVVKSTYVQLSKVRNVAQSFYSGN